MQVKVPIPSPIILYKLPNNLFSLRKSEKEFIHLFIFRTFGGDVTFKQIGYMNNTCTKCVFSYTAYDSTYIIVT